MIESFASSKQACPSADCNKKVVDEGGEYRCEKCNRTYPDYQYRLIMSVSTNFRQLLAIAIRIPSTYEISRGR